MRRPLPVAVAAMAVLASCSPNHPATAPQTTSSRRPSSSVPSTTTPPNTSTTVTKSTLPATTSTTNDAVYLQYRGSQWIAAENARPGTDAWRIPKPTLPITDWIDGYAGATSARIGDTIELHVAATESSSYHVEAYRMGYYGGKRGRLIWQSGDLPVGPGSAPVVSRSTYMAEARWPVNTRITVGTDWPPGTYLLKLVTAAGAQSYVPITIRDDNSSADLVAIDAVATWQAYNDWGACSLYKCMFTRDAPRATVVSFDRPIFGFYNHGSADYIDHELGLVALAEQLGLDITYVTDVDLHEHPSLVLRHKAVLTLGHDEYYSTEMYDALLMARDSGVNVAFFGANAVYRRIRFEPGYNGVADRRIVNYRSVDDPAAVLNRRDVTVNWREAPLSRPEAALIGIMYQCAGAGDMTVEDSRSWIWAGTGATDGMLLKGLIGSEYDHVYNSKGVPRNLEVWSNSFVDCRGHPGVANSSYYTAASGAGVFATGTIDWICAIDGTCTKQPVPRIVRQVTINVLKLFASGPAGHVRPSMANSREVVKTSPTTAPPPTTGV